MKQQTTATKVYRGERIDPTLYPLLQGLPMVGLCDMIDVPSLCRLYFFYNLADRAQFVTGGGGEGATKKRKEISTNTTRLLSD